MRNDEPWFVAKDVCNILGTKTNHVRQIAGNKRVASVNIHTMDIGNHGGKDILIVSESGLYKLIMVT